MMRVALDKTDANHATAGNSKHWLRPYSPYWLDSSTFEFKLLVNLEPKGIMSCYIDKLLPGQATVEFRGPIGNFLHEPAAPAQHKRLLIITQGVAIASSMRIVEQILNNEEDYTRIWLFACFQDLEHVYFRQQLMDFNRYWNFSGRLYLSRQRCACCAGGLTKEDCLSFRQLLRYKEAIFLKRLDAEEIVRACGIVCAEKATPENIVILCGSTEFQKRFAESISKCNLQVKDENILLL